MPMAAMRVMPFLVKTLSSSRPVASSPITSGFIASLSRISAGIASSARDKLSETESTSRAKPVAAYARASCASFSIRRRTFCVSACAYNTSCWAAAIASSSAAIFASAVSVASGVSSFICSGTPSSSFSTAISAVADFLSVINLINPFTLRRFGR